MFRKVFILILLVVSTSLVFGDTIDKTKKKAADVIQVNNAFVRAMPPGQKVTAAFLELKNTSDNDMTLIRAESDASEVAELHEHTMVDGMMSMGQVYEIALPKNSSVALKTGGYHIMMINLKKDLVIGQTVNLTLNFKDGSSLVIHPEVMKK